MAEPKGTEIMGINMNDAFPSKWLRAADIEGEMQVTIKNVTIEEVGDDERKPICWFREYDKGLVMNKTNANNVTEIYGPDSDNWIGQPMTLATAMVDFQGKSMRALRLYPPLRKTAQKQPQQATQTGQQFDERNPPPAGDNEYVNAMRGG